MTRVPSGSDGCAAVSSYWSNTSPFAVRLPWKPGPYHDATPTWTSPPIGGGDGARKSEQPPAATTAATAIAAPHPPLRIRGALSTCEMRVQGRDLSRICDLLVASRVV